LREQELATPKDPQTSKPTIIYKVGGSLLNQSTLTERLRGVLRLRPNASALIVAGGGATADIVRQWDRRHGLGEENSHWLALSSVKLNESLLLRLLPEARLVTSRSDAGKVWDSGNLPIVCAHKFTRQEEPYSDIQLPHCWDVTSDSIAAWITLVWPADELVLLKSTSLTIGCNTDMSKTSRFVDSYFLNLARQLPCVSWSNLRQAPLTINHWLP